MNEPSSVDWAHQQISRLRNEMTVRGGERDTEGTSFFDSMPMSEWRSQLHQLREFGDLQKVEEKELEIIRQVQQKLSLIPFETGKGTPEQMISGGTKNCEGATILGSVTLEEIGINHRILISESPTHQPGHVLVLPISSNRRVFWSEMTGSGSSEQIDETAFSSLEHEVVSEQLADLLSSDQAQVALLLTDSKLKKKAGNEIWGLVNGLSIKVDILSPDMGRKQIVLDRHATNLNDLGNHDQAEHILLQMVKLGFDSSRTLSNLAWTQAELGKLTERAISLEQLVQRRPLSLNDWRRLALTYRDLGDKNAAEDAFKRGISMKPGAYLLHGEYAGYLISEGRSEEALERLTEFISNERPNFATPYLDLINHFIDLKRNDDALKVLRQLQEIGFPLGLTIREKVNELTTKLTK